MAQDWRKALKEHNEDGYAHSAARHTQTNEWVQNFQTPIVQEIEMHRNDAFAHTPMTSRMVTERDTRLTNAETRLGALERFKAQAIVLGGIGLLLLGATATAVATKLLGVH